MPKSLLLCLGLTLIVNLAVADPPNPVWSHFYGGNGNLRAYAMCRAADGSVILAGSLSGGQNPGSQAFVMKVTADGDSVWSLLFPAQSSSTDTAAAYGITPAFDGTVVVAGVHRQVGFPYPFLMKVDLAGDTVWVQNYATIHSPAYGVVQTLDSAFAAAGRQSMGSVTSFRIVVLRTGPTGATRWSHSYGPNIGMSFAFGVAATSDNGSVVAGRFGALHPGMTLFKVNAQGDSAWSRVYGADSSGIARAVIATADSGYVVAGSWLSDGSKDNYLVCTDTSGTARWQQHWGGAQDDSLMAVVQVNNGLIVVAGCTTSGSNGPSDGYLAEFERNGTMMWEEDIGGTDVDALTCLAPSDDGGFYAAGYSVVADGTMRLSFYRFPPNSGITGTVRDSISHQPVSNAIIRILGRSDSARSDANGHYQLSVSPATYDLASTSPCTQPDTVRNVVVLPSTYVTQDWRLLQPSVSFSQTSITLVVHNHVADTARLVVHNSGPGVLEYSISIVTADPPGDWLSAMPDSGMVAAHDSTEIMVRVRTDTTDTHNYEYLGFLQIHSNSCPDTMRQIAVGVTVLKTKSDFILPPSSFSLSCAPNPFNPTTEIAFTLLRAGRVSLTIYDLTGREEQTLTDEQYSTGEHHLLFDGSALPSGVYFARLTASNITRTQKLLLLK